MLIQIMSFFLNIFGFAVGVSNQSTALLKAMSSPAFSNAVKYYFDPTYATLDAAGQKEVLKGVTEFTGMISGSLQEVSKAATDSAHMAALSVQAAKGMSAKEGWFKYAYPAFPY